MKKNYIFLLIAAVCFSACNKEKIENEPASERLLYAEAQTPETTRTALGGDGHSVNWVDGDELLVNGQTSELKSGAGSTSGTFTFVEAYGGNKWYAAYPAATATFAAGSMTVNIPAVQTYSSNVAGVMPMAAYAEADSDGAVHMNFKNAANLLKIRLQKYKASFGSVGADSLKINSIVLVARSSAGADVMINGNIPVTVTEGVVGFDDVTGGTNQTRLDIENPIDLKDGEEHAVYIVIPKLAEGTKFRVIINTVAGPIYSKECLTTKELETTPNHIATAGIKVRPEGHPYIDPWYEGEGIEINTVIWAPVNKGYSEEHPYGLLYQWGRKDGCGYDAEWTDINGTIHSAEIPIQTTSDIVLDSKTKFKDLDPSLRYSQYYNYLQTKQNSTTTYEDWSKANGNDPCPAGWRVPTIDDIKLLWVNGYKNNGTVNREYDKVSDSYIAGVTFTCRVEGCNNTLFLSRAGCFYAANKVCTARKFSKTDTDTGYNGRYWCSQWKNSCNNYLSIPSQGSDEVVNIGSSLSEANGYLIRCVSEAKGSHTVHK